MDGIIKALLSLNPNIKMTANAITLQSLNHITEGFEKHGLINNDIICVNIAKSKKIGTGTRYDMMLAQNPVYIITSHVNAKDKL
jgi:precorrin-6Y C5,15-methyltransferase (decarboxylating)